MILSLSLNLQKCGPSVSLRHQHYTLFQQKNPWKQALACQYDSFIGWLDIWPLRFDILQRRCACLVTVTRNLEIWNEKRNISDNIKCDDLQSQICRDHVMSEVPTGLHVYGQDVPFIDHGSCILRKELDIVVLHKRGSDVKCVLRVISDSSVREGDIIVRSAWMDMIGGFRNSIIDILPFDNEVFDCGSLTTLIQFDLTFQCCVPIIHWTECVNDITDVEISSTWPCYLTYETVQALLPSFIIGFYLMKDSTLVVEMLNAVMVNILLIIIANNSIYFLRCI